MFVVEILFFNLLKLLYRTVLVSRARNLTFSLREKDKFVHIDYKRVIFYKDISASYILFLIYTGHECKRFESLG